MLVTMFSSDVSTESSKLRKCCRVSQGQPHGPLHADNTDNENDDSRNSLSGMTRTLTRTDMQSFTKL